MEKYIAARSTARSSITKLITKIETTVLNNNDPKIDEINDYIDLLNEKEKDLNELNSKIFDIIETEDVEKEITSVETYKENILLCRNKMKRLKSKLNPEVVQSNIVETNVNYPVVTENNMKSSNIKLPRLQIETFDGDICKWPNFWSRFKISIHENESLSNVEKFSYLKSYLIKDAERAIAGLLIDNDNYEKAIKILESRFGRKDLIIDKHMSALLRMAPCKNSRDISSLRNIYDTCDLQINALKGLGIETDSYGTLLFPVLLKALPNDIFLLFTRNHRSDENKITDLIEFLKVEIESRERASLLTETQYENNKNKSGNFVKPYEDRSNKFRSFDNKNKEKRQTTATLNVTTEKYCVFCDKLGNHVSDNCDCYDLNEKKKLLKEKGRCFSCYKKFHLKRFCRSKVECLHCHSKEHRKGLCDKIVITDNDSKITDTDSKTVVTSVIPIPKNEIYSKPVLL